MDMGYEDLETLLESVGCMCVCVRERERERERPPEQQQLLKCLRGGEGKKKKHAHFLSSNML